LFIQFDKTAAHSAGIRWPSTVGASTFGGQYNFLSQDFTQATAQVVNQPLPALDIAQNKGWARVLKQSTVITANGTEASFSSGGEQNYRITSGLIAELRPLSFGTTVKVLPRFDPAKHELGVKVDADISDLTAPSSGGTDIPGRNVTKLNTQVSLKIGQALVLSGIHTQGSRKNISGVPGLSQIPILGALFGSRQQQTDEVEGAIYLLPGVVEAMPKRQRDLVKELLDSYESYSGKIKHDMRPGFPEMK
jgi:pilus assembly protein CpaC